MISITYPVPAVYTSDTTEVPLTQTTTDTSRPEHYLEFVEDPGEYDDND